MVMMVKSEMVMVKDGKIDVKWNNDGDGKVDAERNSNGKS